MSNIKLFEDNKNSSKRGGKVARGAKIEYEKEVDVKE